MSKKNALLLLPNLLGSKYADPFLPKSVADAVLTCDGIFAESEKGGRQFLRYFMDQKEASQVPIALYTSKTPDDDIDFLLEPLTKGESWGIVSDAGPPCVSDPGHMLVRRARELGIQIKAFVGPSSILLGLMLSGLPGERFFFQGYLPRQETDRNKEIIRLDKESARQKVTQIFIETPYRNQYLLESLVAHLDDNTRLAIAWDLTLPTQGILSQKVALWKKSPLPALSKKPAIFLLFAG